MAKVISFSNQKGGVGKTTTCVNMSAYLAQKGKKVLLIDMDPQGNATTGLGVDKKALDASIYNILVGNTAAESVVKNTVVNGLDILPANIDLAGAEVELVSQMGREFKLKDALDKIKSKYDYITIDTPPSLGLLTINALVASNSIIIPIQSEFFALEGLSQLLNTVKLVKARLNKSLEVESIIITMYDARSITAKQISDQIVEFFGKKIFTIAIPRNVRLSEAPSFGVPIMLHDKTCAGARAYEYITDEFLKNQKRKSKAVEKTTEAEDKNG